jgi:hypothetical protein
VIAGPVAPAPRRSPWEAAPARSYTGARRGRLRSPPRARAQGIVTQVTDVKPLLTVATYLDDASGYEVYQEVTGRQFQPLEAAPAPVARASGGAAKLQLQTRGSKFVRFQEAKLQERAIEARPRAPARAAARPLPGCPARARVPRCQGPTGAEPATPARTQACALRAPPGRPSHALSCSGVLEHALAREATWRRGHAECETAKCQSAGKPCVSRALKRDVEPAPPGYRPAAASRARARGAAGAAGRDAARADRAPARRAHARRQAGRRGHRQRRLPAGALHGVPRHARRAAHQRVPAGARARRLPAPARGRPRSARARARGRRQRCCCSLHLKCPRLLASEARRGAETVVWPEGSACW